MMGLCDFAFGERILLMCKIFLYDFYVWYVREEFVVMDDEYEINDNDNVS